MFLTHSPDDDGWYWTRYSDWKVSQLFATEQDAKRAKRMGELTWVDPASL